jgi:hypothetical protein
MAIGKEVIKDFSEYFTNSISLSLETIKNMKYQLSSRSSVIININLEINEIYIKIRRKLEKYNLDDKIEKMKNINLEIQKQKPFIVEIINDRLSREQKRKLKKTKDYQRYRELVEEKEYLIWECLEDLALTTKDKENKKLLG